MNRFFQGLFCALSAGLMILAGCNGSGIPAPSVASAPLPMPVASLGCGALTQSSTLASSMLCSGAAPNAPSCTPAPNAQPTDVTALITFYGWPDNSPPSATIDHPIIHQVASGSGTYCDPTTYATGNDNIGGFINYGTRIYVKPLQQYFILEDTCTNSGPSFGNGSRGCTGMAFDLWIGGTKTSDKYAVINCEDVAITPDGSGIATNIAVTVNPPQDEPVANPGPIYIDNPSPAGTCYGQPGNASTTQPGVSGPGGGGPSPKKTP